MNALKVVSISTFALFSLALMSASADAHSASDAYLTFTVPAQSATDGQGKTIVNGQWDIALRDLDFVLALDDDGDGNILWRELRAHQAGISRYAYKSLRATAEGRACKIIPTRQMVDDHADGAYAALFFDVECAGKPKRLTLDYQLFFAIDPSHRGILVMHSGSNISTAVLSPENSKIDLPL